MATKELKNTQKKAHWGVGFFSILNHYLRADVALLAKLSSRNNSMSDKNMGKDVVLLTRIQLQRMGVSNDS